MKRRSRCVNGWGKKGHHCYLNFPPVRRLYFSGKFLRGRSGVWCVEDPGPDSNSCTKWFTFWMTEIGVESFHYKNFLTAKERLLRFSLLSEKQVSYLSGSPYFWAPELQLQQHGQNCLGEFSVIPSQCKRTTNAKVTLFWTGVFVLITGVSDPAGFWVFVCHFVAVVGVVMVVFFRQSLYEIMADLKFMTLPLRPHSVEISDRCHHTGYNKGSPGDLTILYSSSNLTSVGDSFMNQLIIWH